MGPRTPTLKRKRSLEEWIDETAQHSSSPLPGSVSIASTDFGIVWLLYEQCLQVMLSAFPLASRKYTVSATEGRQSSPNANNWKELNGSLFLWGEALGDGRLDSAISQSEDLKNNILELLLTVSETISQGNFSTSPSYYAYFYYNFVELLPSLTPFAGVEERAEIQPLKLELDVLIDKARVITTRDATEEQNSDSESLFSQASNARWELDVNTGETSILTMEDGAQECRSDCESLFSQVSDAGGDARTFRSLRTAVSCLMDLLPSIDHALTFLASFPAEQQYALSATDHICDPAQTYARFSEADSNLTPRGEGYWQRDMPIRAKLQSDHLFLPSEPLDAGMESENQSKSTSQSSYASPSSFVTTIEEKGDGAL